MAVSAGHGGLCATCAWARIVETRRGTAYLRCSRAESDARYAKYPRLPVLACDGYQRPEGSATDADREIEDGGEG